MKQTTLKEKFINNIQYIIVFLLCIVLFKTCTNDNGSKLKQMQLKQDSISAQIRWLESKTIELNKKVQDKFEMQFLEYTFYKNQIDGRNDEMIKLRERLKILKENEGK